MTYIQTALPLSTNRQDRQVKPKRTKAMHLKFDFVGASNGQILHLVYLVYLSMGYSVCGCRVLSTSCRRVYAPFKQWVNAGHISSTLLM